MAVETASWFEAASRVSAEGFGGKGMNGRVMEGVLTCLDSGADGEKGEGVGFEG